MSKSYVHSIRIFYSKSLIIGMTRSRKCWWLVPIHSSRVGFVVFAFGAHAHCACIQTWVSSRNEECILFSLIWKKLNPIRIFYSKSLIIGMTGSRKSSRYPQISGSWYCKDLWVKNPDNSLIIKLHGIFYQSRYCKDHVNWVPDNRGLAVVSDWFLRYLLTFKNLILVGTVRYQNEYSQMCFWEESETRKFWSFCQQV